MNSGEADGPACPVAIHPYGMSSGALTMSGIGSGALQMGPITSTTALGSTVGLPTGLALGNIDIANSWFPGYHDIRPIDHGNYDTEISSINYQDISSTQKYEPLKYEYNEVRTKPYEEQRLYHKEPVRTVKEEDMKFEPQEDRCDTRDGAAPAKRGRPTENPCWGYFIRLDDQNVRCRLCNKVVKSACATNMTKHLERHHQQDYQQLIVQIKQYRCEFESDQNDVTLFQENKQQKGPVASGLSASEVHQTSCILSTNQYVKTENYAQQLYTQFEREDMLRNCSGYDRNDPSLAWQRGQWSQWPSAHDPSTSGIEMGVLHGCISSSPSGWNTATPGTSAVVEKPYMKRNRKTEHPVWEYFKRTPDGNAQCGICTGVVKSPCSSNFMRHLMRHHSAEYNDVYVKWVQKRGPNK